VWGVGDVSLPACHRSDLRFQSTVHRLLGSGESDEAVALDRNLSGDGFLSLSDLLIDPA
jgi:hypothetical protein